MLWQVMTSVMPWAGVAAAARVCSQRSTSHPLAPLPVHPAPRDPSQPEPEPEPPLALASRHGDGDGDPAESKSEARGSSSPRPIARMTIEAVTWSVFC